MTHEAVTDVVAGMEDLDASFDILGLRTVRSAIPEHLPHLFGRRVQLDRVLVALHHHDPSTCSVCGAQMAVLRGSVGEWPKRCPRSTRPIRFSISSGARR